MTFLLWVLGAPIPEKMGIKGNIPMTRFYTWLIVGAALAPLFSFAMEPSPIPMRSVAKPVDVAIPIASDPGTADAPKPYEAFKEDAETIVAFLWKLTLFQEMDKEVLTQIPLKEHEKTAYRFSADKKDKYQIFIAAVRQQSAAIEQDATQASATDATKRGIEWMGYLRTYRHEKSVEHKAGKQTVTQEKTVANWRTVAITLIGATTTMVGPVVQHFYPTGCATNATAAAARFLVNQTFSLL